MMSRAGQWWTVLARTCVAAVLCVTAHAQSAQLTVTPSPTLHTVAGTGSVGDEGDNGPATAASFRSPRAIAEDAHGNLYIADTDNHVIRRMDTSGTITTVAGTGQQGFSGDGAKATTAELNTPNGIIVAPDGTLYIADTLNHRVRKVDIGGIITTVAGSGKLAGLGDNGSATSATLRKPVALALDTAGNLYIADSADCRIRKVDSNGIIRTVAGTGQQGSSGDGGVATAAELDGPSSLAIDTAGQLYIGDRRNGRVRVIDSDGTIRTVASGEGSAGTPKFVRPDGIAISADGSLYIADAARQKLFRKSSNILGTEAGSGEQAVSADSTITTAASLDRPTAVLLDSASVYLVERGGKVSNLVPASMQFPQTNIGSSAQRDIQLANTGETALVVDTATLPAPFTWIAGTCGTVPIHLAAGQSCTATIGFTPAAAGSFTGSAVFSGANFLSQTVRLSGQTSSSSTKTATTTALQVSSTATVGQPLTLAATLYASGAGVPTGDITFFENSVALGSAPVHNSTAQWSVASPSLGAHTFSASYSGDTLFAPSTSAQTIATVGTAPPDFLLSTGNSSTTSLTVAAGAPALFQFQIAPVNGAYGQTVTFSTQGLPSGVVAIFDPPAVVPGSNPQSVLMTIKVLENSARTSSPLALIAISMLPVLFTRRKRSALLATLILVGGCASRPAPSKVQQNPGTTQNITVVAKASGASGAITTRTITIALTVR